MFRSLHMKLTLILLLLVTALMAVVGAFLTASVTSFYIDTFYQQMDSVFGADRRELCRNVNFDIKKGIKTLIRKYKNINLKAKN